MQCIRADNTDCFILRCIVNRPNTFEVLILRMECSLIVYFFLYCEFEFEFWCLTPLSAIFQLYHGDQFKWWKKPEYPERTTDHGQETGKLYHLRLRVECTLFVIYKAGANPRRIDDRLV